MKDLKINKGIELMLRGDKKEKPVKKKGFNIAQVFSILNRKIHFNFEIRWEKKGS